MKGNFIDIITKKIKINKNIFSMFLFVLLFSNYWSESENNFIKYNNGKRVYD